MDERKGMKKLSSGLRRRESGRAPTYAIVAGLVTVILAVVAVFAVTAQAGVNNQFARVQRAALRPAGTALGATSTSAKQSGYVVLKPRSESALKSFIAGVSNRHSATYHHYLKAGQFQSRFGPTTATIDAVKAQLVKDGLKVGTVSRDGLMIPFSGTTKKVQTAFHTSLARFRTQAGVTGQLATKSIQLPASVSHSVSAVIGLDTLVHPETDLVKAPKSLLEKDTKAKTGTIKRSGADVIDPNPGANTGASAACKTSSGGNAVEAAANEFGGLTDDQIANAYGAFGEYNAGNDGAGVHIALYELEPFAMSDLQTFDECYFGDSQAKLMSGAGTSGTGNVKLNSVDGGQPAGQGSGEAILDIEDLSAMAPGANIDVYTAPNTTAGGIDDYAQIINADKDQIISSSWGECEQDEALFDPGAQESENYIFQQAAAQGQTLLSAAGDTGDDTCNEIRSVPAPTDQNPLSVNDPSSQPYVMAVGGTTLQDADTSNFNETVWNDGAQWGGGGGGISQSWAMPSWQRNSQVPGISDIVPGGTDWNNANDVETGALKLGISDQNWSAGFCQNTVSGAVVGSTGTPCRALPDVSAQADEFTGAVTIYEAPPAGSGEPASDGWSTIGGTSSATPIWAGLLALVDESSACTASNIAPSKGGNGIGFVPPLLYTLASDPAEYAQSFHDITVGNNDVYGFDGGKVFPARTGFDLATGLGTPILTSPSGGTGLAADLCGLVTSGTASPVVSNLNPAVGSVAGGNSVTITGTGFASGDAVQVGGATVPSADVTVNSPTSLTITMPAGIAAAAPPSAQQTDGNTGVTSVTGGSTQTQDGAGLADVVVTTAAGASSAIGSTSGYQYVDENGASQAIPTVTSVSPFAALENNPGTITIYGSGFGTAGNNNNTVTVGGVAATNVTVVNSYEITATAPAYSSANTACVTSADLTTETGDSNPAADDICQTQVVVTNANGSSKLSAISPTYEGPALSTNQDGVPEVPVGFEMTPQPTEFDYIPAPTITSVSTVGSAPATLANDGGGTVVQLTGSGLNPQTLNWIAVGDPTKEASVDISDTFYSGTQIDVVAPSTADFNAGKPDVNAESVPVAADTMANAGNVASTGQNVVYAGLPKVTSVSTGTTDASLGLPVAPTTGGSALTVNGSGFSDASVVEFNDVNDDPVSFSQSTDYDFTAPSATQITTTTPNSNPALDDVQVCTVSGCSTASSLNKKDPTPDLLLFYPPGKPVIKSINVTSGPAAGGRLVTITGENLACTSSIKFGSVSALNIQPTAALLDCGSTSSVSVVAPPGKLGSSVAITLKTVETDATGGPAATSPKKFKYTANPKVSTSKLNFGSAVPGKSGATKTVTVKNPSGAPALTIGKESISGTDKSNFSIEKNKCSKKTLAGGKSCTLEVKFAPSKFGKRTAKLSIPFDETTKPLTVSLSGTGASKSDSKKHTNKKH
jgi:Pro-kumamolisin, activation domain/Subtilase family/Abnormal spindle-like microcephaly-assoc'd, ASPM-SPD-2-Hydin/IPT/TIG domain